ncbi:MAG TPA: thioredoxin domain-containing protein [Anaerolineales bacterium]|nr:thioredoxin domain-containing protein [Anaerolineales bacterium]
MSKRDEIRERRRREHLRNRILAILAVIAGAAIVFFVLILPTINTARTSASATQTAANATPVPVVTITPRTFTAKVDGVHLGDPNAPVKVDVYGDFRCSACLFYTQNIEPTIIQNYVDTGKVYYTFHSYIVIDGHDGSDASYRSANAAMCASAQNHFWDMHDTLYANQLTESASLFTDARLETMAQNIGLDMTAFDQCYQAKQYASEVQQDIIKAQALNVSGTPSVFVNGTFVQDFQQTAQAIDTALAGK